MANQKVTGFKKNNVTYDIYDKTTGTKVETLETTVNELSTKVTALENKTDKDTVYDDAALAARVTALENNSSTSSDNSELSSKVSALESTVGDSYNGLVKEVNSLSTTVGNLNNIVGEDARYGLQLKVGELESQVSGTNGLVTRVTDLESKVDSSSSGSSSSEFPYYFSMSVNLSYNSSNNSGVTTESYVKKTLKAGTYIVQPLFAEQAGTKVDYPYYYFKIMSDYSKSGDDYTGTNLVYIDEPTSDDDRFKAFTLAEDTNVMFWFNKNASSNSDNGQAYTAHFVLIKEDPLVSE